MLAASLWAQYPDFTPETVRALMVHAARWTPAMLRRCTRPDGTLDVIRLLRTFGYGQPDEQELFSSAGNALTLIAQAAIQPFLKEEGAIKTRDLNLHALPWPTDALQALPPDTEATLRVTLSYFIEPSPGERGWDRKYGYPSHGLRFAVQRPTETVAEFRERINRYGRADDYDTDAHHGDTGTWMLDLLTEYPHLVPTILSSLLRAALAIPDIAQRLLPLARRSLADQTTAPECRLLWLAAAYLLASDEFRDQLEDVGLANPQLFWKLRDFIGHSRHHDALALQLTTAQSELVLTIAGRHFTDVEEPTESCGIHNAWDAADFVRTLLTKLSNNTTLEASDALARLDAHPNLTGFLPHVRHARANQHARRREVLYVQPDWPSTVAALNNGRPASAPDLHALLVAHLHEACRTIAGSNEDAYRHFWNEDPHQLLGPKPEESCRDALLRLIRDKLARLAVTVEPEGDMVSDKRADLVAFVPGAKVPIEIKRDYHADAWTAAQSQLERAYTGDPETSGYGIYLVLWFGEGRPKPMPRPPGGGSRPTTWMEMEEMLRQTIPADQRTRLAVVVVDVTDPHSEHTASRG